MDENYKKAVKELYSWQYNKGEGSNFHSILYSLFQKADLVNRMKLERGFPDESKALNDWYRAECYGDALFAEHGLLDRQS